MIRLRSHLLLMSWVRDIPLQALLSGNEVVDDIRETDIGASDEAKEANKEESSIFGSSDSKTNYLRPSFPFLKKNTFHCL